MERTKEIWEEIGNLEETVKNNPTNDSAKKKLVELYLETEDKWLEFDKISKELIKKYPNDISLLLILYKGYLKQDKPDLAKSIEDDILKASPTTKADYLSLVEFFKMKNDLDKAFKVIEEAESKKIATDELFLAKLDTLIDKGDIQGTLKLLSIEKLKELKDPDLYLIRAKLIMESKENKNNISGEVEYLCLEAIKLSPKKIDAYMLLIETYTKMFESHDKVIFLFKLAETNEVENLSFYRECLSSLLNMNEINSVGELYEVIEEYSSESDKVLLNFIKVIHLKLANVGLARLIWYRYIERKNLYDTNFYLSIISIGENVLNEIDINYIEEPKNSRDLKFNTDLDQTKDIISKAILYSYDTINLLEAENPEFYFLKGMFLLKVNETEAEKSLKEAIKLDPIFPYAKYELGMHYFNSGRLLEAYDQFRNVFKSSVYDVNLFLDTYMNLSEICIKFGWIDEAENYLDEAKNISPKDYRVHLSLGKIFFKEAKILGSEVALEKAEDHLSEALNLNPDNCEAAYYLGGVYYEEKLYLPAIRYYQVALNKGLVNERGEKFATPANCYFWISRAYYQMYKDLLFSSKEYINEAIKFAKVIPIDNNIQYIFLEYLLELYTLSDLKSEATEISTLISEKYKKRKKISLKGSERSGVIRILSVFSPSTSSPERGEKAVFSKGNLSKIQVVSLDGSGKLSITGHIGESFKNSINVAFGFAQNYLESKGYSDLSRKKDIYVDIPGWFPMYDGPSAGSAIAISILSSLLDIPIPDTITVTGELSILGDVSPVGGIKEKIEATVDKNIERVYIPRDNKWDYLDMLLKGEDIEKLPEVVDISNVSEIIEELLSFTKEK